MSRRFVHLLLGLSTVVAAAAQFQCTLPAAESPGASQQISVPRVVTPAIPAEYPIPPEGFDRPRAETPKGKLETVTYPSKAVNGTRRVDIWTPPDYSKDKKYPLLIMLHGIGGNETHEWTGTNRGSQGQANVILDNLYADKKIVPMVVIFPNGNATPVADPASLPPTDFFGRGGRGRGTAATAPGRAAGTATAPGRAGRGGGRGGQDLSGWTNFTANDLLKDLIPFVESNYSVYTDRDHQALGGLSMGSGQTRVVVLANPDRFAFVGMFSGGTLAPSQFSDFEKFKAANRLVFLSFGASEGGAANLPAATETFKQAGINATYYVSPNSAHDMVTWRRSLYHFSQLLFREKP